MHAFCIGMTQKTADSVFYHSLPVFGTHQCVHPCPAADHVLTVCRQQQLGQPHVHSGYKISLFKNKTQV